MTICGWCGAAISTTDIREMLDLTEENARHSESCPMRQSEHPKQ